MPEPNNKPIEHDSEIIESHIKQLSDLAKQGEKRGKRLTILERTVRDNDILVKDALGIREKSNGERKKQIEEAFSRISEVKEESEDETKSIRDLLVEIQKAQSDQRVEVAEIKGFIKGQDKREAAANNLWNNRYVQLGILIGIISIIIGFFQVQGGWKL